MVWREFDCACYSQRQHWRWEDSRRVISERSEYNKISWEFFFSASKGVGLNKSRQLPYHTYEGEDGRRRERGRAYCYTVIRDEWLDEQHEKQKNRTDDVHTYTVHPISFRLCFENHQKKNPKNFKQIFFI